VGLAAATVASLAAPVPALARDLHVAPGGTGDGSAGRPLGTVAEALLVARDGDRVLLHEGDYGDLLVRGTFGAETFVEAAPGETARLRTLEVRATNLTVRGLSVSLSHGSPYAPGTMVTVHGSSARVTVADCDVFAVPDGVAATWDAAAWASQAGTGISVRAPDTRIVGNRVRNVGYGISVGHDAPRAYVARNHVQNFSRDGLRGIGDDGVFEYNVVLDAYDVDDHHDDFFQSWSLGPDGAPGGGVRRGVVLRGNLFVNFTDPSRPFAGDAQGIGCFDGFFEGWVIENNVVIVNHWHGITLLGARDVRIVNNTLLDNRPGERPGPPWIRVAAHKDGRPSSGVVIRNNLTPSLVLEAESSTEDHNVVYRDAAALFVDPAGLDVHLRATATEAIDRGSADGAPAIDRDGIPRPQGAGVDVGAYEWHDGSAFPADGGTAAPDAGPPPPSDGGPAGDGGGDGAASARDAGDAPSDAAAVAPPAGDAGGCGCAAPGAGEGARGASRGGAVTACAALGASALLAARGGQRRRGRGPARGPQPRARAKT
jgi:hypothetical protein